MTIELARASYEEKDARLAAITQWQSNSAEKVDEALQRLKSAALTNGNVFEELLRTARTATLG